MYKREQEARSAFTETKTDPCTREAKARATYVHSFAFDVKKSSVVPIAEKFV